MDDALGDHESLPRLELNGVNLQVDQESPFNYIEKFIKVIVLVPVVFAFHNPEPNDRVIHAAQRLVVPLVSARRDESRDVDYLEGTVLLIQMSGIVVCLLHDRAATFSLTCFDEIR